MALQLRAFVFSRAGLALALATVGLAAGGLGCDPGSARVMAERQSARSPLNLSASAVDHHTHGSVPVAVAAPWLEITVVTATEAEDGRGGRITAPAAPRGLDVHADGWRGRAVDPVLHVGTLRFHHYTFPAKGVMRFVVDDVARLRSGDEVALQWGDEVSSRVVLTPSLEVPR